MNTYKNTIILYLIKVSDFTHAFLAQKVTYTDALTQEVCDTYVVVRGDGTVYRYSEDRVVWKKYVFGDIVESQFPMIDLDKIINLCYRVSMSASERESLERTIIPIVAEKHSCKLVAFIKKLFFRIS
jgi:hypothetical protein